MLKVFWPSTRITRPCTGRTRPLCEAEIAYLFLPIGGGVRHVHEANLSASPQAPGAGARISAANEHPSWPPGPEDAASAWPQALDDGLGVGAANRLRRGREFDRVYKEGRSVRGALLVVRTAPGDWPTSRWGFVVSKKTAKRAVDRNRLRRQLRNVAASGTPNANADRVVSVTRAGSAADFRALREELRSLLARPGRTR